MTTKEEQAKQAVDNWHLGQTSARYETSNAGPGTISTGKGDLGGMSYGTYQLSSNMGTLKEFLEHSGYNQSFKGMTPKSTAFNEHWKDLAKNDPAFAKAQHDFGHDVLFQPQLNKLERAGFDLSQRGKAVHDMVWSTSIQYRNNTTPHFERAFPDKSKIAAMTDQEIITRIQDDKLSHHQSDFRSSPDLWNGIRNRIIAEKAELLKLANQEEIVKGLNKQPSAPQPPANLGNYHHAEADVKLNTTESLSKSHQSLIADSEKHIHSLYKEYGLTVDKGTHHTVMSVAAAAAEQGMIRIDRSVVKDGNINVAQMDGAVATMATVKGNVAANTPVEQSLSKLASIEQSHTQAMNNPNQTLHQQPQQGLNIG
jgi:hypothetical protein